MENNIYDLLNEVEVDLNDYEVEEFTPLEEKRILNKFWKKNTNTTKIKGYKKYMAVASAAVITLGVVGSLPTLATMNPELYKIATILGLDKDLEEYAKVVNKPITKAGITIGLGEVVYDRENYKLHVTTYVTTPEPIEEIDNTTMYDIHERVYINGKGLNTSSMIEMKQIDEYTIANVISYNIKDELEGQLDIKVWIPQVFVGDKEYRNHWVFEFTVDGEKLAQDTQIVNLNKTIGLSDGGEIRLEKFTNNTLGKVIYYKKANTLSADLLELRGEDNLGNPVVFVRDGIGTDVSGELRLSKEKSNLSPEATSLNLRMYICDVPEEEGEFNVNYEPVGELIHIQLDNK